MPAKTKFYHDQPSFQHLRAIVTEKTSQIYSWVGAGLSADGGIPVWAALKEKLCEACNNKINATEDPHKQNLLARLTVATTEDYWEAFGEIQKILGKTTYAKKIEELTAGQPGNPPRNYALVWKISHGVLTSNIDTFAELSHRKVYDGEYLHTFDGVDAGKFAHLLKTPERKLIHAHGRRNNPSTWVFTAQELDSLWSNKNGLSSRFSGSRMGRCEPGKHELHRSIERAWRSVKRPSGSRRSVA